MRRSVRRDGVATPSLAYVIRGEGPSVYFCGDGAYGAGFAWTIDELPEDSPVPPDFEAQCRITWRNVLTVLEEAGMGVRDLAMPATAQTVWRAMQKSNPSRI